MDLVEAQLLADIIISADGHCPYCATDLMEQCNSAFAGIEWYWDDKEKTRICVKELE